MSKQANVGFIGAGGFISAHHLVTANESEYLNIAAIADLNEETLKRHAETKPVGYTTTDYKKLLADKDIDIIVIGTKQDLHASLIVEALVSINTQRRSIIVRTRLFIMRATKRST